MRMTHGNRWAVNDEVKATDWRTAPAAGQVSCFCLRVHRSTSAPPVKGEPVGNQRASFARVLVFHGRVAVGHAKRP
jgi:hypothetical protein